MSAAITQEQMKGTLMVAVSGMCYGSMSYFGTQLFYLQFSLCNMLFWRFAIASLFVIFLLLMRKKNLSTQALPTKSLLKIFITGTLTYSLGSGLYFMACKQIGTGLAMVIFFSFPVFVTLFAWLFDGWRCNFLAVTSLLAVLIGLNFLRGNSENSLNNSGVALALAAGFCFAVYIYGNKQATRIIDAGLLTLLVCVGNSILFAVFAVSSHTFKLPNTMLAWIYVFAIGIIATALPLQLLLDGLKYVTPIKASILSVLEPVVTVIVGFAFLNESMSHAQIVGVMIILCGALLIQFEEIPWTKKINKEI